MTSFLSFSVCLVVVESRAHRTHLAASRERGTRWRFTRRATSAFTTRRPAPAGGRLRVPAVRHPRRGPKLPGGGQNSTIGFMSDRAPLIVSCLSEKRRSGSSGDRSTRLRQAHRRRPVRALLGCCLDCALRDATSRVARVLTRSGENPCHSDGASSARESIQTSR